MRIRMCLFNYKMLITNMKVVKGEKVYACTHIRLIIIVGKIFMEEVRS